MSEPESTPGGYESGTGDWDAGLGADWMRYALQRIRALVDRPREQMSEDELTIFTFAQNALAGGEPVIRVIARGPGVRLCRICLAEWNEAVPADHVHGCPLGTSGAS